MFWSHSPNIALCPLFFFFKPLSLISAAYVTNSWMCGEVRGQPPRANSLLFWQLSVTKNSLGR